jgi:lipopolysaccharide transport system permease protein
MNEEKIQEIIIEPRGKLAGFQFRELWNYRELLRFLVVRDIKVRYKQTVLGGLWAILQPFMNMVVLAALLLNLPISWTDILISGAISIGLFVFGIVYFKKMERRFADII